MEKEPQNIKLEIKDHITPQPTIKKLPLSSSKKTLDNAIKNNQKQ